MNKNKQLKQQQAFELQKQQQAEQLKQTASQDRLKHILNVLPTLPAGAGISETSDGATITRQPSVATYDLKKQHETDTQVNKYAKNLEKYSDAHGAALDLERITNRDGKGGVFTNPDAKLSSGGKIVAGLPDAAIGLGGMLGVVDKNAAEERKAIKRYQQALGVAMGGARGMSPGVQQGIRESTGAMSSGDPALMAKGIRGAGRIIGTSLQTVQAGFNPEIRGAAHANSGMDDPMDFYRGITTDGQPPVNYNSPPAGSGKHPQQDPEAAKKARIQELLNKKNQVK